MDKRTTEREAVSEIRDGMTIGIGGWGSRRKPMSIVREILRSSVKDLTVVTYGAMTEVVEDAMAICFDEDEVVAEYLIPSQLAPLRAEPIVESVSRTGRLVVVEEGTEPWGFGAEVVSRVSEELGARPPRCARVGAYPLPIPSARPAEKCVLPGVERVVAAIRKVTR